MLNRNKTGMALGSLAGLGHVFWSVLVFFGWGQAYLDFIFNLHTLNNPLVVGQFNLSRSVLLIIVTAVIGYILGFVFASIWNKVHK